MQSAQPDGPTPSNPKKQHPAKQAPDESRAAVPNPLLETWTVWEPNAESAAASSPRVDVAAEAHASPRHVTPDVHFQDTFSGEVIDGHTTPVDEPADEPRGAYSPNPIPDVIDEVLIGRLGARSVQVEAGEVATLSLSLLNNGREPALFEVQIEGWVDERWFPDLPVAQTLEPGVWTTLAIAIAPPRESYSWAGEHAFAFTLRSPQHPDRITRLGATVDIAPFAEYSVSGPAPDFVEGDGRRRMGTTRIHIHNRGNETMRYRIWGMGGAQGSGDKHPRCEFAFRAVGDSGIHPDWLEVEVEPGALLAVGCRISGTGMPPLGPFAQSVPFRLVVAPVEDSTDGSGHPVNSAARKVVGGRFEQRPLVGVWLLTALLVLGVGAVIFAVIVGAMAIFSLQAGAARPAVNAATEPPVVAIMLHMDEILPPRAEDAPTAASVSPEQAEAALNGNLPPGLFTGREPIRTLPAAQSGNVAGGIVPLVQPGDVSTPGGDLAGISVPAATITEGVEPAQGGQTDGVLSGDLPMVQADQVSVPGASGAATGSAQASPAQGPPAPVENTSAPLADNGARMTYAQMFQDVAWRFDLDWRMLAAQAYVESGFDSLALGSKGSMGLMQIQPQTWREFAPAINAVDPFDSYSNALVAGLYLDYLRRFLAARGYPQVEWMLVAYNWGPDQLMGYLNGGGNWAGLPAEVRGYAEDVLRIARTLPAAE